MTSTFCSFWNANVTDWPTCIQTYLRCHTSMGSDVKSPISTWNCLYHMHTSFRSYRLPLSQELGMFPDECPTDMAEKDAPRRVVRVRIGVRPFVVASMVAGPFNYIRLKWLLIARRGRAITMISFFYLHRMQILYLCRRASEQHEDDFQGCSGLVTPMRPKSMSSRCDTQISDGMEEDH